MKLVVRKEDLKSVVGISPATARRLELRGDFPRRRQLTPDLVGWNAEELKQWVESRPCADNPAMRGEKGAA